MNSGVYGWAGDRQLHLVHKFDGYGLRMKVYERGGNRVALKEPFNWTAADLVARMTEDFYAKNPEVPRGWW